MIEVERRALLAAMRFAGCQVEKISRFPVLTAMHAHANGRLHISGTDLDMAATASVPFTGQSAAPFLLENPRTIDHALRHAGDAVVAFDVEDGAAPAIQSGTLTLRPTQNCQPDDWPVLGDVATETFRATLCGENIREIARCATAMSSEETRYYLNGVYLHHVEGWNYRAVATDGHRLIAVDLALPDASGALGGERAGVIVPRDAIRVLADHFAKADSITVTMGNRIAANAPGDTTAPDPRPTRVSFAATIGGMDVRLTTKTIDGTFPDYRRVYPPRSDNQMVVEVRALRQALQALSPGRSRIPAVALRVGRRGGTLVLSSAMLAEGLAASIEVAAETSCDAGWSVGFNGRYLLDVLSALRGDQVVIEAADTSSPAMIRDPADPAMTAILMPMKI